MLADAAAAAAAPPLMRLTAEEQPPAWGSAPTAAAESSKAGPRLLPRCCLWLRLDGRAAGLAQGAGQAGCCAAAAAPLLPRCELPAAPSSSCRRDEEAATSDDSVAKPMRKGCWPPSAKAAGAEVAVARTGGGANSTAEAVAEGLAEGGGPPAVELGCCAFASSQMVSVGLLSRQVGSGGGGSSSSPLLAPRLECECDVGMPAGEKSGFGRLTWLASSSSERDAPQSSFVWRRPASSKAECSSWDSAPPPGRRARGPASVEKRRARGERGLTMSHASTSRAKAMTRCRQQRRKSANDGCGRGHARGGSVLSFFCHKGQHGIQVIRTTQQRRGACLAGRRTHMRE